jgi:hypothetical protein
MHRSHTFPLLPSSSCASPGQRAAAHSGVLRPPYGLSTRRTCAIMIKRGFTTCCPCMVPVFQMNVSNRTSDVKMLHMLRPHVANVLSECCIFNERFECNNQHETNVVMSSFLIFRQMIRSKISTYFWCCQYWHFFDRVLNKFSLQDYFHNHALIRETNLTRS